MFGTMSPRDQRRYARALEELERRKQDESWREYLERVHTPPPPIVFDPLPVRTPEEQAAALERSAVIRAGVRAFVASMRG